MLRHAAGKPGDADLFLGAGNLQASALAAGFLPPLMPPPDSAASAANGEGDALASGSGLAAEDLGEGAAADAQAEAPLTQVQGTVSEVSSIRIEAGSQPDTASESLQGGSTTSDRLAAAAASPPRRRRPSRACPAVHAHRQRPRRALAGASDGSPAAEALARVANVLSATAEPRPPGRPLHARPSTLPAPTSSRTCFRS
jgi:hypothetical protein